MKFLFAYKGRYHVRDSITLEYLSALAKQFGHQSALLYDQDIFGVTDNVFASPSLHKLFSPGVNKIRYAIEEKPDAVIFLDSFNRRQWNAQVSSLLKESDQALLTVLVSASRTQEKTGRYDFFLLGEPEYVFERFLKEQIFASFKGTYNLDGLCDLDMLPSPDKSLFSSAVNFSDSYLLYASKGCPYACSYCEETIYQQRFGKAYFRRRSSGSLLNELEQAVKRFKIKEIIFKDSVFAADKKWLEEFLTPYAKRLHIPFKCFGKSDTFDQEIAAMLKKGGCYCIEFGAQNFNETLKQRLLNRNEANKALLAAFSICDKFDLRYDIDHLFGIPGESIFDHKQAGALYGNLKKLNRIKCHNLVFYPEAPIFELAPSYIKENQRYNADYFSSLSAEKDMRLANLAFQKYFKILPLFPAWLNRAILRKDYWKAFRFIPGAVILLLMMVLALKHKDLRFWVYAKLYPLRLRRYLAYG